jgi:hypothetical protein
VERYSTGIHDPLLSSVLYLADYGPPADGRTQVMFIANDIIFVGKATAERVRRRIEDATGVPGENILVSATHTHSGPSTVDYVSLAEDPTVPKVDPAYLQRFEDGIVAAALAAYRNSRPAELGLALADATGVGTNRRNPASVADPQAPVLLVRAADTGRPIACLVVYSMHPTVLREASAVVSGDFPAMARRFLQQNVLSEDCPVIYHTGPAGNQSPRHVVRGNILAEAARLGEMLGRVLADAISRISFSSSVPLQVRRARVDLPRRVFPSVPEAERKLETAVQWLTHLRQSGAPRQQIRGAEVDWFGAEETLRLARIAAEGRLEAAYRSCLPAEVQALQVGQWWFVGWPGEIFVEHALAVKAAVKDTFVISLANGELQGYIATEDAAREGGYEASNAIFAPESGRKLVEATLRMLGQG